MNLNNFFDYGCIDEVVEKAKREFIAIKVYDLESIEFLYNSMIEIYNYKEPEKRLNIYFNTAIYLLFSFDMGIYAFSDSSRITAKNIYEIKDRKFYKLKGDDK